MLMQQCKPIESYTCFLKDLTITVETMKSIGELLECIIHYNFLSYDVAKLKQCMKTLHNVIRNMAFDGRKINLHKGL